MTGGKREKSLKGEAMIGWLTGEEERDRREEEHEVNGERANEESEKDRKRTKGRTGIGRMTEGKQERVRKGKLMKGEMSGEVEGG